MSKLIFVALVAIIGCVASHGTVHDPVARQTRWRYDSSATPNYDDVGVYCGGISALWQQNGGRCGVCGDNYAERPPRSHELGGTFGQGVIVKTYSSGANIRVEVRLSANHMGFFQFDLCSLDSNGRQETNACFDANLLRLTNGADRYTITQQGPATFNVDLSLPSGLRCDHCVLRWSYTAANNWGTCADGSGALGCGPQELFRSCSDIRIN